jgi:hypothetical protein
MASEEEETVRFLTQEAKRAVAVAQSKLLEQGIGYVTGDEFSVQKHLPFVKKKGKKTSEESTDACEASSDASAERDDVSVEA